MPTKVTNIFTHRKLPAVWDHTKSDSMHAHTQAYTHIHTHTHTHLCTHTNRHTYTYTHTHTHTHTCMHARTHTHTHTNRHTYTHVVQQLHILTLSDDYIFTPHTSHLTPSYPHRCPLPSLHCLHSLQWLLSNHLSRRRGYHGNAGSEDRRQDLD